MFRLAVITLFVVSATCVDVLEVSGNNVVKTADRSLPLRSVSGFSAFNGANSLALPVGQAIGVNPVLSTYGVSGLSGLSGISGISGIGGIHHNLQYLRDLRSRVLGNSINIAPSTYSYLPFGQSQSYFGQNQAYLPYGQSQSYLALRQPQTAISFAQPTISLAQPVAQQLTISQPQIAVARPQFLAAQQQIQQLHPVNAAITQVARTVEYRPVPFQDQPIQAQEVVVEPSDQPINIHFRSRSSTVRISQDHIPGEVGEVVQTQSQDEPSRVQHEVVKPVVQEVREVIQPYRQVTQEIQPVVENVHTVVSHGEGQRQQYVAEPVVRQQLLNVRPVQQLSVQQYAVPQQVQQVQQVVRPHYVAVSQPAVAQQIGTIAVARPQYQTIQSVVPQYQTVSVQPQFQVAQPYLSSYYGQNYGQNYGIGSVGSVGIARPIGVSAVRSVGIAQPVVGVNRVVVARQPDAVVRQEVREVRPAEGIQSGRNYVSYAESN